MGIVAYSFDGEVLRLLEDVRKVPAESDVLEAYFIVGCRMLGGLS